MTANDERVPAHYTAPYIHWDLVVDTGMGYLEGNATKYVSRWRKKGGRADLEKAVHYVAKLREVAHRFPQPRPLSAPPTAIRAVVYRFAEANHLDPLERQVIEELACWQYIQDVDALLNRLPGIVSQLVDEDNAPPPPLSRPSGAASAVDGSHMTYGDRIYDTLLKRYARAGEFLPDGDVDVHWEDTGEYGLSKWHRCRLATFPEPDPVPLTEENNHAERAPSSSRRPEDRGDGSASRGERDGS